MTPVTLNMNTAAGLFHKRGKKWYTTRDITFFTRYGPVFIPAGTETDLFSCVPNTEHPEFWLAALLHDFARKNRKKLGLTRHQTDLVFRDEMTIQAYAVYERIYRDTGDLEKAMTELWKLNRRSFIYYRGVAGICGTVYMIVTEIF